ncbi:MAG TPA: hypothetical protein VMS14_10610 [Ilumatobacteraceae bacterium]|nr:hypothetical protein [Ilumatobacteraceae bacterium]HUC33848.1 hypothetical protein [Ilumatobacteraceae bacterium]
MRTANVVVTALGLLATALAVFISWRGRRLPTTNTPVEVLPSAGVAALDGLRVLAASLSAGVVAGALVPGLGGRLLMRVLGATSGNGAQGRLTEAEEVVGEITFDGSLGFLIFVGLGGGLVSALLYLVVRRILPSSAWSAGLVFGLILLALFGTADPLSPDNVDFKILRPLPLAVAMIAAAALLFGTTFAALMSRIEGRLRTADRGWRRHAPYASFVFLILPPFALAAAIYVAVRVLSRGRIGVALDRVGNRWVTGTLVVAGSLVSLAIVLSAVRQILD